MNVSSIESKQPSEGIQQSLLSHEAVDKTGSRVSEFVRKNKSKIFFASSVALSIGVFAANPTELPTNLVRQTFATGAITACALGTLSTLLGVKIIRISKKQTTLEWYLGGMNVAAPLWGPLYGLTIAVGTTGFCLTSLAFQKIIGQ